MQMKPPSFDEFPVASPDHMLLVTQGLLLGFLLLGLWSMWKLYLGGRVPTTRKKRMLLLFVGGIAFFCSLVLVVLQNDERSEDGMGLEPPVEVIQ